MKGNSTLSENEIKSTLQRNLGNDNPSASFQDVWNSAHSRRKYRNYRKPMASIVIVTVLAFIVLINTSFRTMIEERLGFSRVEKNGIIADTESSYLGVLNVNGKEYMWVGIIKNNEYTINKKIGEVKKSVAADVYTTENFSSNILKVGEKIYSSNEDSKVIIVEREDGNYHKFSEIDLLKNE
ncbi:hypothetical protein [Gottfriedia luciferensis]|uniref:hypothetical protein n=1 Tax=Gottfriedia luciferensis TaxID=178774 RepID=UPI000B434AD9|nr:hypothetical protein [Gottfriedia luciferensis]